MKTPKILASKNRVEYADRFAEFDPEFKDLQKQGAIRVLSTASDR
jgi:hypothetical protein